jgi:hypothetical protein
MTISTIHSYLVHPAKNFTKPPSIGGTSIPLSGNLYDMLHNIYNNTPDRIRG